MGVRILLVLFFFCHQLSAQMNYFSSSKTYTSKDGLSSDRILSIHKDVRGFMWIGTEEGLNRFDGQEFKVYSKKTHPKMTINAIHRIVEDEEGWLWLLKANEPYEYAFESTEIVLLNIFTNEFSSLEERFGTSLPFESKHITFIKQLSDQSILLWSGEDQKGFFYREASGFHSFSTTKEIQFINDAILQKDGNILLETAGVQSPPAKLFKIDKDGNLISKRKADLLVDIKGENKSQRIKFEGSYYLTGGFNSAAYNLFDQNLSSQNLSQTKDTELIDQSVWNEEQQLLWIKTSQKIRAVNKDKTIVFESKEQLDFSDIPILFDGNITWLSNKREGLVAIKLEPNYFQIHRFFEKDIDNSTRGIFADEDGLLLTSTIKGVRQRKSNGIIAKFPLSEEDFFTSFLKDMEGNFWGIEFLRLVRYNPETKEKKVFKTEFGLKAWSLFEDKNGNIWTHGEGNKLYALNPKTEEFTDKTTLPNEDVYVYFFAEKDEETIWVCTDKGLFAIDLDGTIINEYNTKQTGKNYLPANDFHHLHEDANGTIWLATGEAGLIRWFPNDANQKSTFQHFTVEQGLSSNTLHSIYEDENDYLWISSENGLMQLDKRTEKIVTYNKEAGVPHNEFNRIAHFQRSDGQLYFGGINGMVTFHPRDFAMTRNQNKNFPLAISEFKQFSGKEGRFENLTTELIEKQEIKLKSNDRFFNIKLALLDFENGHSPIFSYRIKGLYDWQKTKNSELGISGLPYGNHILEIKAQNANQQSAMNALSIPIQVLRPFYLTGWFMALSVGMFGLSIFYFVKRRTRQMLIVQEAEQLRNLDKMKSQFFANISHELRTPITLILGPLAQFIKNNSLSDSQKQELTNIQDNGKSLLNLVNEVLDLSKLEAGKLTINSSPTKIPQFIERLVTNFESAAIAKEIEFQFMSFLEKDIVADFDKNKLEKILNNLLTNALKFTSKKGIIQIMVAQLEQNLLLKIKDSGRGISKEDLPFIFDRYFQSNQNLEGGTGIGLALTKELTELMGGEISVNSKERVGTEFVIKLPIHPSVITSPLSLEEPIFSKNLPIINKSKNHPGSTVQKETILLVEDNLSLQNFIKSILETNYKVIIANNGVEALNQLPIIGCQLILSDVMMPEMDGFTLLKKVKSNNRFCSIPFILLTARADIKDKLMGLRFGVDDYMTKPFEIEELLLRIKNLLANTKNRVAVEIPNSISQKHRKLSVSTKNETEKISLHQPTTEDLEWLSQVETIAWRELKNKYFSTDFLADELYVSKSQLFRKIKRITGLTPMRYIKLLRLQKAKRMLETEEVLTLTEVCFSVGLENTTHFAKAYEAEFGKRPHEFLKKSTV